MQIVADELVVIELSINSCTCFGRLFDLDNITHHTRAFFQLDHGDGVGAVNPVRWPVVDDVAVEPALARWLKNSDGACRALGAKGARWEIIVLAAIALEPLTSAGTVPEGLSFRCRLGSGYGINGHDMNS